MRWQLGRETNMPASLNANTVAMEMKVYRLKEKLLLRNIINYIYFKRVELLFFPPQAPLQVKLCLFSSSSIFCISNLQNRTELRWASLPVWLQPKGPKDGLQSVGKHTSCGSWAWLLRDWKPPSSQQKSDKEVVWRLTFVLFFQGTNLTSPTALCLAPEVTLVKNSAHH